MTEKLYSLEEVYGLLGRSDAGQIHLRMILAKSHADQLSAVEAAVDWAGSEMTKNRHVKLDHSEDALSIDLVTSLKAMGFQASHDTQYGGHCDIVVEAKGQFLWIAECKIHSSYDWLLKGFAQLDTRYSTGLPGQDAGEMIIYSRNQRADQGMASWKERLKEARPDVEFHDGDAKLMFRTTHTHELTGATFRVRHICVPLYFKPVDRDL
ncbi:hypothetical protein [Devosia marina]|uniref:Uncharacterized protein n=1 Tax=Devosia marina TaxID=2683198 RepID=A0A7X3FNJ6_9HYPH|nr:hypothetical protein [Devosia marina]MVS97884.1 hypothetical protein [Devosia marina]